MCLLIDWPRYRITNRREGAMDTPEKLTLQDAWQKLKGAVSIITPDARYQCACCQLRAYCKWCPARSWLYTRQFTCCDPENKRMAAQIRKTALSLKPS